MKIFELVPRISKRYQFNLRFQKFIFAQPGCYVLSNFDGEILYIGLTDNLQRRFGEHRNNKEKNKSTKRGTAFWFYFITCSKRELQKIERTWLNQYEILHSCLPVLNKNISPIH